MRKAMAVVGLLLVCGGCSGDRTDPDRVASSAPASTAASSGSTTVEEPLPCVPGVEPFTGPAAETFGPERVMEAYCLLAGLVDEQTSTSLALPIPEQDPRDLRQVERLLSDAAATGWDRLVAGRAAGDAAATARVDGLTLHDVRRVLVGFARAGAGTDGFGTQVGPATARVARGEEALALSFTVETALVLEEDGDDSGRHSLLPVTRDATYVLVPRDDGWLIDDWDARFRRGAVRLASG